jgi:undecaprenyl-diphosphatase
MMPSLHDLATAAYGADVWLFRHIHPAQRPSVAMARLARVLADAPLLASMALVGLMGTMPRRWPRRTVVDATLAVAGALVLNLGLALLWPRARPFVAGVGQAWMAHAATGSFPSDHLTVQWTVAGILLLQRSTYRWGVAVALLGLPMAWARIYLGVHYPGDMLGALWVSAMAMLALGLLRSQRNTGVARWDASNRVSGHPGDGCEGNNQTGRMIR